MSRLQLNKSLRFLLKKKNHLAINILGLGVGIASFLILFIYLYNDATYNHFNDNLSNIYRVREGDGIWTKGVLLPKMLEDIPEIENGTRIFDWDGFRISYNQTAFPENIFYVDTGFFSVFSFPFVEGSEREGVHEKYGVVISDEFARKYFGDESAVGKDLQVKFDDIFLHVNGVVKIPNNSSIKFDILASYETGIEISPWVEGVHDWYNTFSNTYVLLKDGVTPQDIDAKMQDIVSKNFLPVGKNNTDLNLLAFEDYHASEESNQTLTLILTFIALGIIIIAVVNFINLSITSSLSRSKEIGVKKLIGASGNYLFLQIMKESLIVSFIATLTGYFITVLLLPFFNRLFDTQLVFNLSENLVFILILISIWLVVGIISGIVPSLFWVRSRLGQATSMSLLFKQKSNASRYSLVIVQFVIAIVLISGTFLVRKQISFMMNKDPKFDKENIIVTELESWQYEDLEAASRKFKRIADELEASPYVESVCFSQNIPGTYNENYNTFYPEGEADIESLSLRQSYVGRNYFKTYGIKFLSGEGFDTDLKNYENCVILNKTAMQKIGYTQASDQILRGSSKTGYPSKLIGEVEDFSYQGANREMQPLAHFFVKMEDLTNWDYLSVRTKPGASLIVTELIKEKWQETKPSMAANYFFAEEKLNEHYNEYVRVNKIIVWFSIVAIILSCVGLFALSAFATTQRIKEIGIRKVNGAKMNEILGLLNINFLKWVVIAIIISSPIAYFAMNKWLQNFALKTQISWWIFALAGAIALFIALVTVSWQSWRAANRNPVEALRYE